jgi:site-specific DNA-adenine methylase
VLKSVNCESLLDPHYYAALQPTTLLCGGKTVEELSERYGGENNFCFLDPPYDCAFGREEHVALAQAFRRIANVWHIERMKNRCMIVIADTPFIHEL